MKRTKQLIALLLATVLVLGLAACGGGSAGSPSPSASGTGGEAAPVVYRELYVMEATTLNYLVTSQTTEFELSANFIDTLVQYDQYGVAQHGLATDWSVSDDGLTWTFTLRDGVKWYKSDGTEYADLKAQDFVDSMHYICDPAHDSKTFDIVSSAVKNAQKFYSGEITDPNEIGVRAVDEKTLEYTLEAPTPYFLSMLSYVCFMPVNGDFLAEVGDRFGTSADTILYNGAYICQEFNPQENQVWVKNANYWNADNVNIDRIERTYNAEALKLAPDMYKQGSVDQAKIPSELLQAWLDDASTADLVRPTRASYFTYWWLFNFDPQFDAAYEPDNWKLAVNNEAFRLSIARGIDRAKAEFPYEPNNPNANLINTITPEGFCDYSGTDYTFDADDARLILVNANLPFAGEPSPNLAPANEDGTIQLEAEAADAYRQMSAAAAEDGVALVLSAGYQDADARTAAYEAQKQQYLEKGKTEEEAASLAADIQPPAECNDHGTGYAADILPFLAGISLPAKNKLFPSFAKTFRRPSQNSLSALSLFLPFGSVAARRSLCTTSVTDYCGQHLRCTYMKEG